jgi:cyanobactin maturation PatA/PatG family protease
MPPAEGAPPNPFVAEQMVKYLEENPSESTKLIWTFNLELTPIYAIEAEVPYAREVYEFLRKALKGQIQKEDSHNHITRVSLPGFLSDKTVRLFSGQILPVVVAQHRGLWSWNVRSLIDAVVSKFDPKEHGGVRASLHNFLDKVYYELRNLGQSSPDRALNYSATNAFQAREAIINALHPKEAVPGAGIYTLDDITVSKSPFCRMDSDCWDVKLTFFDPENDRRARMVMRFTVDVSDELPVTLGPVRHWTESGAVIRVGTLVK